MLLLVVVLLLILFFDLRASLTDKDRENIRLLVEKIICWLEAHCIHMMYSFLVFEREFAFSKTEEKGFIFRLTVKHQNHILEMLWSFFKATVCPIL